MKHGQAMQFEAESTNLTEQILRLFSSANLSFFFLPRGKIELWRNHFITLVMV